MAGGKGNIKPEDGKQLSLDDLRKKMSDKERVFCHEYIIDWNKARAARAAGYSENSAKDIGYQLSTKLYIQQYIELIKDDIEKEAGITKLRQLNELAKIAYSSIAHLHETWIELKDFEGLTNEQKASIESIETKIETINKYDPNSGDKTPIDIKYVKIKLYSKIQALGQINEMLGYKAAEKFDHTTKGESINDSQITVNYNDKKIDLET